MDGVRLFGDPLETGNLVLHTVRRVTCLHMNRSIVLEVVYKLVMSGCFYAEGTLLAFEKLSLSKISLTQHATIDSN